jgi:hypothetical protein
MTKHETEWQLGDMPDFDPIEMKAKVQAEILRDTEGMTDEEIREYFRLASERMALRRKAYARRQATEPQTR